MKNFSLLIIGIVAAILSSCGTDRKSDVKSGGADSPRQVVLRSKPSTGQWFLWDQFLLSGIRKPKSQDE